MAAENNQTPQQPKANEANADSKGNPIESPKINPSHFGWIVAGVLLLVLMFRK